MSHGCSIEVSRKPIECRLGEVDYFDTRFYKTVADYVSLENGASWEMDLTDRGYQFPFNAVDGFKDRRVKVDVESVDAELVRMYNKFRATLESLSDMPFKDFIRKVNGDSALDSRMIELRDDCYDEYSTWIWDVDCSYEPVTWAEWVRDHREEIDAGDLVLYVGSIMDYHW